VWTADLALALSNLLPSPTKPSNDPNDDANDTANTQPLPLRAFSLV